MRAPKISCPQRRKGSAPARPRSESAASLARDSEACSLHEQRRDHRRHRGQARDGAGARALVARLALARARLARVHRRRRGGVAVLLLPVGDVGLAVDVLDHRAGEALLGGGRGLLRLGGGHRHGAHGARDPGGADEGVEAGGGGGGVAREGEQGDLCVHRELLLHRARDRDRVDGRAGRDEEEEGGDDGGGGHLCWVEWRMGGMSLNVCYVRVDCGA
mmetsp:Transcript_77784/g.168236  ORF Transcript_77784/g.168236 Transcript_77784/m.168236 type:complete len:218 (+) Transcript_77784:38-691(+)